MEAGTDCASHHGTIAFFRHRRIGRHLLAHRWPAGAGHAYRQCSNDPLALLAGQFPGNDLRPFASSCTRPEG